LGGHDGHGALLGAIRSRRSRLLADAELLEPTAQRQPLDDGQAPSRPVTVLLEPAAWAPEALTTAIAALANQSCAKQLLLCCIGPCQPAVEATVARLLGRSPVLAADWVEAARELADGHVLHLGAGIILHDRRTIAHLVALASRDGVAGASCAILAPACRGREWVHKIHSAGQVAGVGEPAPFAAAAANFWNMLVPVARLPAKLWLTRSALLAVQGTGAGDILLLSTFVAASLCSDTMEPYAGIVPSLAESERALRLDWCVA
jgi:hypothetical protein